MTLLSPPQIPLFRITLFYGPEEVAGASDTMHCVFNVKKRSWKGGVQVGVNLARDQIRRLQESLEFQPWLHDQIREIPSDERDDFLKKGADLFIQLVCFHKLDIFIQRGIRQENGQVSSELLISETEDVVKREGEDIKRQILIELDVEAYKTGHF